MAEETSLLTQITALYAALVSTATAAWTIYKDRNDVGRLRVTVGFRSQIGNGIVEDNLLVWHITNTGRRPVLLTHAAGECEPEKSGDRFTGFLINDPQLPRRLEPGDYHMSICKDFDFRAPLRRLFACDSLGREFEAPPESLKDVQENLATLRAKGITKSSMRPARGRG